MRKNNDVVLERGDIENKLKSNIVNSVDFGAT